MRLRARKVAEQWEQAREDWQRKHDASEQLIRWSRRRAWTVFCTLTSRVSRSPAGMQAACLHFLADTDSYSGVTAALWAVEPHEDATRHHAHMLLSLRSDVQSTIFSVPPTPSQPCWSESADAWRDWYVPVKERAWKRFGTCRLWPMRRSESALIWYVLKYVTKQIRESSPRTAYPSWDRIIRTSSHSFISGQTTEIASTTWRGEPRMGESDLPWGIWTYNTKAHYTPPEA